MKDKQTGRKKCFLWFHDWSKWSDPEPMRFIQVDKFTGKERLVWGQEQYRICLICNKLQNQKTI
jgi:hypothetical protein